MSWTASARAGRRGTRLALIGLLAAALLAGGCTQIRRTAPERAANEQLLLSTAADKAVAQLQFGVPDGSAVYLDASNFASYDKGYVVSAIRTRILQTGGRLVRKRKGADVVVEIRAGALSVNRRSDLIGLPGFDMPVPLSESVAVPEVALYKDQDRTGIAKLAATAYDAQSGELIHVAGPVYGLAWLDRDSVLGIGWREGNVLPDRIPRDPPPAGRGRD